MSDGITPLSPAQQSYQEARAKHEGWLHRMLVGADQFLNVVTGGLPDETISSRAARAAENGSEVGMAITKFLNEFQADHGPKAQAGDVARADTVAAVETESPGLPQK